MSKAMPFALGLGGGLALWGLTKSPDERAAQPPSSTPQPATRNCSVRVDRAGLDVDGERVDFDEAVRRCRAAGGAAVTVAADAPASTCAALMTALGVAGTGAPRNARRARPTPEHDAVSSTFTLAVYPAGQRGSNKRVLWFHANPPTTWADARDRLSAAKVIDPNAIGPNEPGAWKLVTDPRVFKKDRAKPLPLGTRDAARAQRYTREGRTILRDGEAILHVERVDLGNERYAISPHEADLLVMRLVRLLNRPGGR